MAEQIVIEYIANVDNLTAGLKDVKAQLKDTQKAAEDAGDKSTDAFGKTEVATKSLKAQLRELKAQLANATDPKEVERLAKAAGKLADQIEDATDAARIFASESKFEQVGNAIGSIGSKLRNLDFKGAADQAKLLGSVLRSVTAKDAISGLKDIGNAIFSIGEAVVGNALFLVPAAMAAIAYSTYDAIKAYQQFFLDTKTVSEATAEAAKQFANFGERTRNAYLGIQETLGIYSKQQADSIRKDNEAAKTKTEIQKKLNDDLRKLAAELNTDMSYSDMAKLAAEGRLNDELLQRKIKYNAQAIKLQNIANAEIASLETATRIEKIQIAITGYKEEEKAAKEKSAKLQEEAKKNNDALIAEAARLNKMLRDLQTANIVDERERRKKELQNKFEDDLKSAKGRNDIEFELRKKLAKDLETVDAEIDDRQIKARQANFDRIVQMQIESDKARIKSVEESDKAIDQAITDNLQKMFDDSMKMLEKYRAQQQALQQATVQFIQSATNSLNEIMNNLYEQQIQDAETNKDNQIKILDEQYKKGLISKEYYESKKVEIERKAADESRALKEEQFKAQQSAAVIQALINTAQGVVGALAQTDQLGYAAFVLAALVAAAGALQVAAIESQPMPKFAKGGWVDGKYHSAGGTKIEAEKDEFIINKKDAMMNSGLLEAINAGNADKYIQAKYIAPILKEQAKKYEYEKQQMFSDNLVASMLLNSNSFKDENLLDSLKRSRQSERENAIMIVSALKNKTNSRNW